MHAKALLCSRIQGGVAGMFDKHCFIASMQSRQESLLIILFTLEVFIPTRKLIRWELIRSWKLVKVRMVQWTFYLERWDSYTISMCTYINQCQSFLTPRRGNSSMLADSSKIDLLAIQIPIHPTISQDAIYLLQGEGTNSPVSPLRNQYLMKSRKDRCTN